LLLESFVWLRAAPRKAKEIGQHLYLSVFGSMPVTFLIALFAGMILALQAGIELSRYGQEAVIGVVVAASMCREMGPVMTAFAFSGLMGSTIAAQLGTMKVSEEIEALEAMSIDPVYFLVMPRVLAAAVAVPVLTVYTDAIGILGGAVVGKSVFNVDLSMYFNNAKTALAVRDIYGGLAKALVFGLMISSVACSQGMRAEHGAQGVGRATLKTVVISFIYILVFDYFLTWGLYQK
jgi:phospholipid/cholesterol/gamma-HCH transport system permease protein